MKINLLDNITGENIKAEILPLTKKEAKQLRRNEQFGFDWEKETDYIVFKTALSTSVQIVGLMSLIDHSAELRIEIHLLEVAKEHQGKEKRLANIAGCLIAYACRMAFDKGYQGFVSLIPKTSLINHYIKEYDFQQYGRQLALEMESAEFLMLKYLNNEK